MSVSTNTQAPVTLACCGRTEHGVVWFRSVTCCESSLLFWKDLRCYLSPARESPPYPIIAMAFSCPLVQMGISLYFPQQLASDLGERLYVRTV